jgi:hypothetical protein
MAFMMKINYIVVRKNKKITICAAEMSYEDLRDLSSENILDEHIMLYCHLVL